MYDLVPCTCTYNSFPSSADTGRDPPPVLDSDGDPCLPVAELAGLTEDGDEPRLDDCAVSRLVHVELGGGVTFESNIDERTSKWHPIVSKEVTCT